MKHQRHYMNPRRGIPASVFLVLVFYCCNQAPVQAGEMSRPTGYALAASESINDSNSILTESCSADSAFLIDRREFEERREEESRRRRGKFSRNKNGTSFALVSFAQFTRLIVVQRLELLIPSTLTCLRNIILQI